MERVVASYRIGLHEVEVVETYEDEGSWYHLVVDGLAREGTYGAPPAPVEAERIILRGGR